ncbi:MAG: hypothetical protein ALECFALPRED_004196 [Alectoria fallacina]|uniref:Cytochrome P450 n=1 Tax=Alectoria fallacina TaxID=1903189 RepID=A0A8H3ESA2_9LECA|nr:MAG: hypothetical protein ALECFALPRED_004196 [Alectoria fallacina]
MGYNPWAFAVISALYFVCASLIRRKKVSSVPLAGYDGMSAKLSFLRNTKLWLEKGQKDYAGRIFRLWTPDGYLHIASTTHLKELNGLGDDHLRVVITDVLMGQYTNVTMSPMGLRALKEGLAQNLGKLMPTVIDEVSYSLDKKLPPCKGWTPVNVYDATTLIAATVGSRIMTGPELGHNQEWIELLLAYTKDVISCAIWLKGLPHVVRVAGTSARIRRFYGS